MSISAPHPCWIAAGFYCDSSHAPGTRKPAWPLQEAGPVLPWPQSLRTGTSRTLALPLKPPPGPAHHWWDWEECPLLLPWVTAEDRAYTIVPNWDWSQSSPPSWHSKTKPFTTKATLRKWQRQPICLMHSSQSRNGRMKKQDNKMLPRGHRNTLVTGSKEKETDEMPSQESLRMIRRTLKELQKNTGSSVKLGKQCHAMNEFSRDRRPVKELNRNLFAGLKLAT